LGEHRAKAVLLMVNKLTEYWSESVGNINKEGVKLQSLHSLLDIMKDLVLFGPPKQNAKNINNLDSIIAYTSLKPELGLNHTEKEIFDMENTAQMNFNCIDYLVRVKSLLSLFI
jgi:hypothetical protein